MGLTAAFSLGFLYVNARMTLPVGRMANFIYTHCSVVFASAYRTSVLFTYTAADPTYTLAPTVGWTAIEMSAGITSACLPTMLPVVNLLARLFGIKTPMSTAASSQGLRSNDQSCTAGKLSRTGNPPELNKKRASDNFYRLPDETDSGDEPARTNLSTPIESKLGPNVKGYEYTVKSMSRGDRDEESRDDTPLHGIKVQKVFGRSTAKR